MILYKYVSFTGGSAILNGSTIGFSNPWDFNDPFELGAGHAILPKSEFAPLVLRSMFERSAILSLTRSPLNPLMWAHYAQNHTGFVIGWDAHSAGFCDEEKNVIPAHHGNVIYTATRPNHPQLGSSAPMKYGQEYAFRPELLEKLQRFFLFKAMCWSYEEEVRVIKCVFGTDLETIPSGPLQKIELADDRPLYLASFPPDSIREIFLGVCNPIITHAQSPGVLQSWQGVAQLRECRLSPDSWELASVEYTC